MIGWRFSEYFKNAEDDQPFNKLFNLFQELILYASGDVKEALSWLTELDRELELTDGTYGVPDFIDDLIDQGYLQSPPDNLDKLELSSKLEGAIRKKALTDLFGKIKKSKRGSHNTKQDGRGDEYTADLRPYEFGDKLEHVAITESIKNAYINHGIEQFELRYEDLEVKETYYQSQMSTVLMIDISHSMILYGEDRITPAKKIALALSEYITKSFPKDTLDIIVFGDDAWKVEVRDIPYLEVGPFHTNTVAGLELAQEILRRRKNPNKQIFMITDGKPTCIKRGKKYYKNSFGLDRMIVSRTLNLANKLRKLTIPVTTFMIARDPYLMEFVAHFTKANNGKAFYSNISGLGEFIFRDYKNNKNTRF